MRVNAESLSDFDVLHYSGRHACSAEDHEQDGQISKYVENRALAGRHRFLVDVRELRVQFGSGIRDLLASWQSCPPSCDLRKRRVAILWRPSRKPVDRWDLLAYFVEQAVETAQETPSDFLGIRCFVEEDKARDFLLAEETSLGEPAP